MATTSLHHLLTRFFGVMHHSMVAQAGQALSLAGSDDAGISTPVWAIAIECGNSCDRS
ncbi:ash family protein [Kluyvera cryocrescens]|nr:ash family protein [Kluyvera cryocrescens]